MPEANGLKKDEQGRLCVWRICIDCSKGRWMICHGRKPMRLRCASCAAKNKKPIPECKGTLSSPIVGDIRRGFEIGKKGRDKCIWKICPDCKKGRWVTIVGEQPEASLCRSCSARKQFIKSPHPRGEKHPCWKGGRIYEDGYIGTKLQPDNFFFPMANHQRYVLEHRLVMAKHLGRCLQSWEVVHHKDGMKTHNNIKNLELSTVGSHLLLHSKGYKDGYQRGYLDGQNGKIEELGKEVKLLRWQILELLTEETTEHQQDYQIDDLAKKEMQ